jgi:hypothetical protein
VKIGKSSLALADICGRAVSGRKGLLKCEPYPIAASQRESVAIPLKSGVVVDRPAMMNWGLPCGSKA